MKKVGAILAAMGFVLALGLFFVRRSGWYAREMSKEISEFGELAEAGFWAALMMTALGVLLLLLGLRVKNRVQDAIDAPTPLADDWVCPTCGSACRGGEVCPYCGADRRALPPPPWVCPFCGTANPEPEQLCRGCGRPRPGRDAWICPWCGSPVDGEFSACTICGAPRP